MATYANALIEWIMNTNTNSVKELIHLRVVKVVNKRGNQRLSLGGALCSSKSLVVIPA